MIEEWVELTDGNQKLVMTRRELRNLAHRVSCIFATARPTKPPFATEPRGLHLKRQPLLEVTVARTKFDRRRKDE